MKILFGSYATLLTKHGGLQQQMISIKTNLELLGHQVYFFHEVIATDLREFDVYHHFSLVPESCSIFKFGQKHSKKVVLSPIFNYSASAIVKFSIKFLNKVSPFSILGYKERKIMWDNADDIVFLGKKEEYICNKFMGARKDSGRYFIGNGFSLPNVHNKYTGEDSPYFIHVGTVYKHKRQHLSILLSSKMNVRVKILGPISDIEYLKELKELSKKLGNSDLVEFVGFVDNKSQDYLNIISGAKFSILPSISEVFPISILEALSVKVPVISTNVISAFEEFVGEGLYLFDFSEELKAIDSVAKLTQEIEVPVSTVTSVNQNYGWDSIAQALVEVYFAK